MRELILLPALARYSDVAFLLLRLLIGSFLIWGVWDNIASADRMREFADFLTKFDFPLPELMAPLSVWVQFMTGVAFIMGVATRWAGLLCAINFIIAIVMVDRFSGIRGAFPALCLVLIGCVLATHGAGRFSIDSSLARSRGR
jgi:putative oxidoreductase